MYKRCPKGGFACNWTECLAVRGCGHEAFPSRNPHDFDVVTDAPLPKSLTIDEHDQLRASVEGWKNVETTLALDAIARQNNPKHAIGMSKVPMHLVPPVGTIYTALVFELGANKYGAFNWRQSAVVRSIYLAAMERHLAALRDGQDNDEESGLPHEAHITACAYILMDAREIGKLVDDRPPDGAAAAVLARYASRAKV